MLTIDPLNKFRFPESDEMTLRHHIAIENIKKEFPKIKPVEEEKPLTRKEKLAFSKVYIKLLVKLGQCVKWNNTGLHKRLKNVQLESLQTLYNSVMVPMYEENKEFKPFVFRGYEYDIDLKALQDCKVVDTSFERMVDANHIMSINEDIEGGEFERLPMLCAILFKRFKKPNYFQTLFKKNRKFEEYDDEKLEEIAEEFQDLPIKYLLQGNFFLLKLGESYMNDFLTSQKTAAETILSRSMK